MTDKVRILNGDGVVRFGQFLERLRGGDIHPPPRELLFDPGLSAGLDSEVAVEDKIFRHRYDFGTYLAERLSKLDRRVISRSSGLWTWLALYYFDQLCPVAADGSRNVRSIQAYILPNEYDYRIYYRHLVRTPWLVALDHGQFSKVLLIPAGATEESPLATRGEIIEQMASRQEYLGNPTIIETAYKLYFDEKRGKPRRGAGGSSGGSPRRLATILQQLGLTYDLGECRPETLKRLLPAEFDRWRA